MHKNSTYKAEIDLGPSMKWVTVKEDGLSTIRKIEKKLDFEKIPYKVTLDPGCRNGSCSITYILMVPEYQVKTALMVIENYFMELHPELQKSKDLEEQGKCPACGFENEPDATTCADCELPFIIEY